MSSAREASRVRSRRSFAQMPRKAVDKENTTSDLESLVKSKSANVDDATAASAAAQRKKEKRLRSKSLGPGGLDTLKSGAGNRRQSTAINFPLKSILKPSIPVSPVQDIPTFEETRRRTPGRTPQQSRHSTNASTNDMIDFSTPPSMNPTSQQNPFDSFSPIGIPLRTEEEQQAAAREREEQERKDKKKQALEHREARRKSLANRRVSFAPEATLHTWNVVEANEDSTTSSAANSTRRESQFGDDTTEDHAASSDSGGPSTPDDGRKSARLSGASVDHIEEDEAFSSSPYGSVAADETNVVEEGSDSESDPGDTVMSMDNVTEHSPSSSNQSTANLDENLRKAAQEAGTRGIEFDENGDLSMEFTEIQGAFQPWIKKGGGVDLDDMSTRFGQEDLAFEQPLAQAGPAGSDATGDMDFTTGEISMDMTNALGQIIQRQADEFADGEKTPQSETPDPDRTQATNVGDQTMDFTGVIGGIAPGVQTEEPESSPFKPTVFENGDANSEDATMEFTSVFGNGSINKGRQWDDFEADDDQQSNNDVTNYTYDSGFGDEDMDMTHAGGGILSPIVEQTEPQDDLSFTAKMDMTNAIGKILQGGQSNEGSQSSSQQAARSSATSSQGKNDSVRRHSVTRVSESGSPMPMSPTPAPKNMSEIQDVEEATTPQQSLPGTPAAEANTPTHMSTTPKDTVETPQSNLPDQANQASPNVQEKPLYPELPQVTDEGEESGEKQGKGEKEPSEKTQQTSEQVTPQQKTPSKHSSLFIEDEQTGQATPSFILRPQPRKSSGLGIDKHGLGSPKVAEILDRRGSIGDEAETFSPAVPPSRGVRFDPREMEKEIEKEKQADESARRSEQDATSNLKDMIQSMSPKKKPVKMARKSLHVGSAVGLLGKRPAELDIDSDEDEPTPKRFRGREASPVKSVRLPAPPSKDQTAGRLGPRLSLFPRSPGAGVSTTPKGPSSLAPPSPLKSVQKSSQDEPESTQESSQQSESDANYKPIRLQDFLEMTNIHFMELTTTKRRHTVAPKDKPRTSRDNPDKEVTLADRVVAGATTLPLLEMYQHSCRELKNYISEGRNIIRSIEEETFAENPPLFKEYLSAPPDVRALMDNQFRNVKTNARLQSKAMWYEWRMKLLDGLKQGLDKHVEDMKQDEKTISKQEQEVEGVLPRMLEERSKLEEEVGKLRRKVEELQSVDREEILATRRQLVDADKRLTSRRKELDQTQAQLDEITDTMKSAAEMKTDLMKEIQEGERLLAERRACGLQEMRQLRASVRALEKKTGWGILSTVGEPDSDFGPCMTMRYRGELKVTFHPKAFGDVSGMRFPSIEFEYSPETFASGYEKVQLPPAKSLIFSAMQDSLSSITSKVKNLSARDFLKGVARDWDRAIMLHDEIRCLQFCGVTRTKSVNESQLRVRCTLVSPSNRVQQPPILEDDTTPEKNAHFAKSRTDIDFIVSPKVIDEREIDVDVKISAIAVYGVDTGKTKQMTEFLTRCVEQSRDKTSNAETGSVIWSDAIRQCEKRVM